MEWAGASIARSGVGVLKVWIRAQHNILDGDAENAGLENAGLENAGTSCVWVAKCNIINVRGHVRVNVTAGRGTRVHCRRQFKAATETYEIQLCRSQP